MRARAALLWSTVAAIALASSGCKKKKPPTMQPGTRPATEIVIGETIYDGKLENQWQDLGWAPRDVGHGPASLNLSSLGGWMLGKPGLPSPTTRFGALVFRYQAPRAWGDFLEVRVDSNGSAVFPRVKIGPEHRRDLDGGWEEVLVDLRALDPEAAPFDRVVLRAYWPVGADPVKVDGVAFTRAEGAIDLGDAGPPKPGATRQATMLVQCNATAAPISPYVYGVAYDAVREGKGEAPWGLEPSARRWGGNPTSRYNPEISAWNTANDWFWENVAVPPIDGFVTGNAEHRAKSAITLPMIGWVAKDTTSSSFPTSAYPGQKATDPQRPEAGNGIGKDGKPIPAGPPTRTSVAATPELVAKWARELRKKDPGGASARNVVMYFLDNEPQLWGDTHRDVHPAMTTYDEIVDRTIRYGDAIREADPDALIAGPAEWGWPGYLFSEKDANAGFQAKPDRRAHGDVPLMLYYLQKLKEHEAKTGKRVLDVLDVHFYPQGDKIFGKDGATDPETAAARIRATRALWDADYVDESWIREPIKLIPRMKEWVAQGYPGRGISIGEWSFGAEQHISGGLATAEALGRFGQLGVFSAFYFTFPPEKSPAWWAFRVFRNFDGKGARFLDWSLPTVAPRGTSLFASRDASGTHMVLVALNLQAETAVSASIDFAACARVASVQPFTYTAATEAIRAGDRRTRAVTSVNETLPPWSMTVLDVTFAEPLRGGVAKPVVPGSAP